IRHEGIHLPRRRQAVGTDRRAGAGIRARRFFVALYCTRSADPAVLISGLGRTSNRQSPRRRPHPPPPHAPRPQEAATTAAPEHATAAFDLGIALEDLGRPKDAIEAYRTALATDPRLADAHYNVARLYERVGKKAAALRHLSIYRRLTREGWWSCSPRRLRRTWMNWYRRGPHAWPNSRWTPSAPISPSSGPPPACSATCSRGSAVHGGC